MSDTNTGGGGLGTACSVIRGLFLPPAKDKRGTRVGTNCQDLKVLHQRGGCGAHKLALHTFEQCRRRPLTHHGHLALLSACSGPHLGYGCARHACCKL